MSARSDATPVWHYDGESGLRRFPDLVLAGDGFVLVEGDRISERHAFEDLIAGPVIGGLAQYGLKKRPGWKIGLTEMPPGAVAAKLPGARRYGGVIDRIGLWPAVAAFAAVSAVALFALASSPPLIAKMIPRSAEARIGALMIGDFGDRGCTNEEGEAALAALARRIGMAKDVELRVVRLPIVNAVTLPGGHVVLFDGLLRSANSPDEVAGVLAHELGHVEHRDVLEQLVRQLGFSVVLSGMGGNVGGYTNALLAASYSRDAEARADLFAIDAMRRSNISPTGIATLFRRLSRSEIKVKGANVLMGYLASHPVSSDREKQFAASAGKGPHTPALEPEQWQALRGICE